MLAIISVILGLLRLVGVAWAFFGWILPWLRKRNPTKDAVKDAISETGLAEKVDELGRKLQGVIDYVDGLPTTPDIHRRELFECARKLYWESKYREAIDLFRQLMGPGVLATEQMALLIQTGNCFLGLSELEEAEGCYREVESRAGQGRGTTGRGWPPPWATWASFSTSRATWTRPWNTTPRPLK